MFEDAVALGLILFLGDEAVVSHLGKLLKLNIKRGFAIGLPSGFVEESCSETND